MNLHADRLPEMIGHTILHSLWQITLLWIVLIAVLRLWPKASSAVRYTFAISILMLCVLTTIITAVYEWRLYAASEEISSLSNGTTQTLHVVYTTIKKNLLSRLVDALYASAPILAWLWCAGLVVMGTRFSGSFYYLKTLRAQENTVAIAPFWVQEFKRLSKSLGLNRDVAIATSTRITSPLTLGSISPIVLLPAGLLSGLSTPQIEAILVHELYHIKRRDYIINICQALVEVLLFYHPAIWHINYLIREERENCCDDQTLAYCGDAITYARALTQIQEINTLTKPTLAISAGGHHAGSFSNRIKRLFNVYPNLAHARSKGIFAIGSLIVYLGLVLAGANVSPAKPIEPEKNRLKTSINDHNAPWKILSDSIPVNKHLYVFDEKEITPELTRPAAANKIRLPDIQHADTTAMEQSLATCLRKVRQLLNMVSIYRSPGEKFRYMAWDSLRSAGPMDYDEKATSPFQSIGVYGTRNSRWNAKSTSIDPTGSDTGKDVSSENNHRAVADSITVHNSDQDNDRVIDSVLETEPSIEEFKSGTAVQVYPNATNGRLNINFTPPRNNSHVKMVLADPDGKEVKEITDSTFSNLPTNLHVDVSGYKKGIYMLQINIDGAKSQQKVVVE